MELPHDELEEILTVAGITRKEQEWNNEHNSTDETTLIMLSIAELVNRRHLLSDITIWQNEIKNMFRDFITHEIMATLECDPTEYKFAENEK